MKNLFLQYKEGQYGIGFQNAQNQIAEMRNNQWKMSRVDNKFQKFRGTKFQRGEWVRCRKTAEGNEIFL